MVYDSRGQTSRSNPRRFAEREKCTLSASTASDEKLQKPCTRDACHSCIPERVTHDDMCITGSITAWGTYLHKFKLRERRGCRNIWQRAADVGVFEAESQQGHCAARNSTRDWRILDHKLLKLAKGAASGAASRQLSTDRRVADDQHFELMCARKG
jgi:hypothetical protein